MTRTQDKIVRGATPEAVGDAGFALPVRAAPTRRGAWIRRGVWAAVFLAAGATAYGYRASLMTMVGTWFPRTATTEGPQTFTVKRGVLRVTVVEEGKLRAAKSQQVSLGVAGKITWLAPAGSYVKPGDLLASVEKKNYEDEIRRIQGDIDTAEQMVMIAEDAIPFIKSRGESDIAAARTKRNDADLALKLYTTLDVPKKLAEFETSMNDTRTKLQEAQKNRAALQTQLDDKLSSEDAEKKALEQQIDAAKESVRSLQKVLANFDAQRKLFRAYSYPQDMDTKQQALANAALEVAKQEASAKSDLLKQEAEVRKAHATLDQLKLNLKHSQEELDKCDVRSPVAGLVIYGNPDRPYDYPSDQIRVGAEWYPNYPLMTIPDLSGFEIDVGVAEAYRGRLAVGAPASAVIEAIPGLTIQGAVSKIAPLSRHRIRYDESSPSVFDTTIHIGVMDSRMVSGMTARVEITAAVAERVLAVPVEAVFSEDSRTIVYVRRGDEQAEKRLVYTGAANDHMVAIAAGLKEGETVFLSRPASSITPGDFLTATVAPVAESAPAPATAAATGTAPATGPATQTSETAASVTAATAPTTAAH